MIANVICSEVLHPHKLKCVYVLHINQKITLKCDICGRGALTNLVTDSLSLVSSRNIASESLLSSLVIAREERRDSEAILRLDTRLRFSQKFHFATLFVTTCVSI